MKNITIKLNKSLLTLLILLVPLLLITGCMTKEEPSEASASKGIVVSTQAEAPDEEAVVPEETEATEEAEAPKETEALEGAEKIKEEEVPVAEKNVEKNTAVIETNLGTIKIKMFNNDAPKTVENFVKLANSGFYDGIKFHRVIKDFMIQTGDPNSKLDDWSIHGMGGPGYKFEDEFNQRKLVKGVIAMANSGPDTNGSQFFIVTAESTPWLDGRHTAFGEVILGMDIVEKINSVVVDGRDHPTKEAEVVMTKVYMEE